MLTGHTHAMLERIRTQAVVLPVQDTMLVNNGTTQPKAGMGTVRSGRAITGCTHSSLS
jgi:hypothetical protein